MDRFHGNGTVTFPNGCHFTTTWHLNSLTTATLHFPDDLTAPTLTNPSPSTNTTALLSAWPYCTDADRRYHAELCHGLLLARSGHARLVDGLEGSRPLPLGCWDVGDGWVGAEGGRVRGWEGRPDVRVCSEVEAEWARSKCRVGRDPKYTRTDL